LRALVTGEDQSGALRRLLSAQLSKHKVLLAAIMRLTAQAGSTDHLRTLTEAYQLLAQAEARDRAVVRDLLMSPQFGAWAIDCFRRLCDPATGHQRDGVPLSADLGQLAVFAATAGFRTGLPFDIEVPLRSGAVTFPGLGTAYPRAATPWAVGRACLGARGGRVCSSVSAVRVPTVGDDRVPDVGWSDVPRFVVQAGGLRLGVTLESLDPMLDRYGAPRAEISEDDVLAWHRMLARAWSLLAGDGGTLAAVVADVVRTLVPLTPTSATRPASSTETSSFGAVGLSLPADALAMAELLVHECHHAMLGAAMDAVPMVGDGVDFLAYAPWREDPRPGSALLQGIFAHYGISRFWRGMRGAGPPAQRLRGDVEFGRWRTLTAQTADVLAQSGILTDAGSEFLSAIRGKLAEWQDEPVPGHAARLIDDLDTEHRVRWRLWHLVPDPVSIESLATAWRHGAPRTVSPAGVGVVLRAGPLPALTANARLYMLSLRHADPQRLRRLIASEQPDPRANPAGEWIDRTDLLLVSGHYAAAVAGYLERIASGDDLDAWAGLAVASRQSGPPRVGRLLAERPEVAAALCGLLRGPGGRLDPASVLAWLAGGL
jgi:HEXXH motif-containing protein